MQLTVGEVLDFACRESRTADGHQSPLPERAFRRGSVTSEDLLRSTIHYRLYGIYTGYNKRLKMSRCPFSKAVGSIQPALAPTQRAAPYMSLAIDLDRLRAPTNHSPRYPVRCSYEANRTRPHQ